MVKILGHKIATIPIEQALQDKLGVEGVCIISIQRTAGDEEIHLVVQSSRHIEESEFEAAANAELGIVKRVPLHVSFVEKLPRNQLGKIERRMLKEQLLLDRNATS